MPWGRKDERPALDRALDAAAGLKPGSWESVEALAMLSIELKGHPEAAALYERASAASASLSSGSWGSVRALAWLARAGREIHRDAAQ